MMTTMVREAVAERHREFESLVERTHRKAYQIAYRITGNREDAEDLTQEAYLRAYRSFSSYNRALPFEAWFYRILVNLGIDRMRGAARMRTISLDHARRSVDGEEDAAFDVPDPTGEPEALLMRNALNARIQEALAALPTPFRIAILLRETEGLSYEEISRVMASSVGTVRSRISRGRRMLRARLQPGGLMQSSDE